MAVRDVRERIEPGTLAVLDQLTKWDLTSVQTIRSSYGVGRPSPVREGVEREDAEVGGVRVRWYRPAGAASRGPLPCLLWLHGGAYIMGNLDENDDRLDRMVLATGLAICSVDWRLAPEHPWPAGLEDAEAVYGALLADPTSYSVDGGRLVVGGASAGAGLAAALCLRVREKGGRQPALQLLIYPMLDDREVTDSIRAAEDPGHWGLWHLRANRLCWEAYLSGLSGLAGDHDVPPTAAPARATDLAGLAPAFVGVGDIDAFVDEDVDYAMRLSRAGVPTELHVYPGVIHGGFGAEPRTPRTAQLLEDVYAALERVAVS
ncbi:MAG TPA: alpha/beta hydrolase [Nocardioides sp.]|nr:alpha/beta hydrolase [Nocardioides sp.]